MVEKEEGEKAGELYILRHIKEATEKERERPQD